MITLSQLKLLVESYNKNKSARLRTKIECPCCGRSLTKNYMRTVFCSLTCKDFYWNTTRSFAKEDHESITKDIHNHLNKNKSFKQNQSLSYDWLVDAMDEKVSSLEVVIEDDDLL